MYSSADLLARTILGEAGNQPYEGKVAVAHSILNRLANSNGGTMQDVLFKPYQYEPWMNRREELLSIDPESDAYKEAADIAVRSMSGELADPTGGATHFLNPEIVRRRRGGSLPDWWPEGEGRSMRIGDHWFSRADDPDWRAPEMAMVDPADQAATEIGAEMPAEDTAFDLEGAMNSKAMKMAMGLLEDSQKKPESSQALPAPKVHRPERRKRGYLVGLLG